MGGSPSVLHEVGEDGVGVGADVMWPHAILFQHFQKEI
jgi:hypothetical protein